MKQKGGQRLSPEAEVEVTGPSPALQEQRAAVGRDPDDGTPLGQTPVVGHGLLPTPKTMTPVEIRNAIEFAEKSRLLYEINRIIGLNGVAGEHEARLAIYLAMTSRLLDNPLNIILKAESSTGKSYVVGKTADTMPPESYLDATALTPRALFYVGETELMHKGIIVREWAGLQGGKDQENDAAYALRSFQSEKGLTICAPVRGADGKFTIDKHEIKGPIFSICTTTKPTIHGENETRSLSIGLDDSEEQTRRTLEVAGGHYDPFIEALPEPAKEWLRDFQRILKSYPVYIPYHAAIAATFPVNKVRTRRDHTQLLTAIETSAILHQYQREKFTKDGKEWLVADLQDYHNAFVILGKTLTESICETPRLATHLLQVCRDVVADARAALEDNGKLPTGVTQDDQGHIRFTIAALLKASGWNRDKTSNWLEVLDQVGMVTKVEGGQGKVGVYRLSGRDMDNIVLTSAKELQNIIQKDIVNFGTSAGEVCRSILENTDFYNPITGEVTSAKAKTEVCQSAEVEDCRSTAEDLPVPPCRSAEVGDIVENKVTDGPKEPVAPVAPTIDITTTAPKKRGRPRNPNAPHSRYKSQAQAPQAVEGASQ